MRINELYERDTVFVRAVELRPTAGWLIPPTIYMSSVDGDDYWRRRAIGEVLAAILNSYPL